MSGVTVRPMTVDDLDGVVHAWNESFDELRARFHYPPQVHTPEDHARLVGRIGHLLASDPEGSWVAEDGGRICGLAQAFVREGAWVLSLLAVAPAVQGTGTGRALMERAMTVGDPAGPGFILASFDPAAANLYASAGFDLHPAMMGYGPARRLPEPDPAVREAGPDEVAVVGHVDRAVRGAARPQDMAYLVAQPGIRLYLCGDRGYAIAGPDRIVMLGARDEAAATALLTTAVAGMGEETSIEVGWITAGQQWAMRALVAMGVPLQRMGPVMVRGRSAPPAPYLPSGGFG